MPPIQNLRKFVAPETIFGNGSRLMVGKYCQNFMVKKPMIVSDPGVIAAGWTSEVTEILDQDGIEYVLYSEVTPNPRVEESMKGAELFKESECDSIIAVGGGSPMDCAKGIGIIVSNGGHILDYEGIDQIREPLPPLIFIPTTAGTSADVSQFCIISNRSELIKIAIISKTIIPDVALIDPETTTTMDDYLTACTGMDALVHAVEAFVSKANSPITDLHAKEAIQLLNRNLLRVKQTPNDPEVRQNVMLASMLAGLAFSNAVLGAVHAMAHSLGGFLDLPHGECNSLLLEHVINFNFEAVPERFRQIATYMDIPANKLSDSELKKRLFNRVRELRNQIGITRQLGGVGVKISDIPDLTVKAVDDACMLTNPREVTKRDIEVIYEEAL